jgi:hypothetical protein
VNNLRRCPDGAEISVAMKLLLFVLSNYHTLIEMGAFPGLPTLAEESLSSISTVKRHLDYLEEHRVIERRLRERVGSGAKNKYAFPGLDASKRQPKKTELRKEGECGNTVCAEQNSSETVQKQLTNSPETVHISDAIRNDPDPDPDPKSTARTKRAGAAARALGLRLKCPGLLIKFERELGIIAEASVGAGFGLSEYQVWKRSVTSASIASERCRIDVEIGLSLCGLSDEQIVLLTRRSRDHAELEASLCAAFAIHSKRMGATA